MERAKKFRTKKAQAKAKPTKNAKKRTSQPPTKNEIELVSTVGILNTWRIQEYLDAIGASERAWSDTAEGTKLFEEIRDELYEIRGWSLLQEIMEAAFHHSEKGHAALAEKKPSDYEEN